VGKRVIGSCALPLVLAACGAQEAWRADLRYLAQELPRRHANAFHSTSQERFAADVRELDAALETLSDDQVLVGLMRIVALVGDGHTHLDLPPNGPRYPFELAWFGRELRIIAADAAHDVALGAQVVGVGGRTLDDAMTLLAPLVPRGENDRRTQLTASILLTAPRVLHGLGLAPPSLHAAFALVTREGQAITEALTPALPREITTWHFVTEQPPLWLRRLSEPWWVELLSDRHTVYLSFSRYPPEAEFRERSSELGRLLDRSGARRLVSDLRRNGGGDFTLVRRYLLPVLGDRRVYAIIGPVTFSAAMVNALDLKRESNAVLVGEPTGGRPNSYSEHGEFPLPHSGLRVSYATRYYRFGEDADTAVEPDRRIEPTWQDFLSGRDPVLDWILAQPE